MDGTLVDGSFKCALQKYLANLHYLSTTWHLSLIWAQFQWAQLIKWPTPLQTKVLCECRLLQGPLNDPTMVQFFFIIAVKLSFLVAKRSFFSTTTLLCAKARKMTIVQLLNYHQQIDNTSLILSAAGHFLQVSFILMQHPVPLWTIVVLCFFIVASKAFLSLLRLLMYSLLPNSHLFPLKSIDWLI